MDNDRKSKRNNKKRSTMKKQKRRKKDAVVSDENLKILHQQWLHQDEGALVAKVLSFLDVKTLMQTKEVCDSWEELCTKVIDSKCDPNGPKAFESKKELKEAVKKNCSYISEPADIEELARTYGYPMDKWDVSQVTDMSGLFRDLVIFEYIGSWDISNVRDMSYMFYGCEFHAVAGIGNWVLSRGTDISGIIARSNSTELFFRFAD